MIRNAGREVGRYIKIKDEHLKSQYSPINPIMPNGLKRYLIGHTAILVNIKCH